METSKTSVTRNNVGGVAPTDSKAMNGATTQGIGTPSALPRTQAPLHEESAKAPGGKKTA